MTDGRGDVSGLADVLADGLVAHVRRRLQELGVAEDDEIVAELRRLHGDARDRLMEELARPFAEQRRGPLEILRSAVVALAPLLAARQVPTPRRDAVAERALPEDVYDLAPAGTIDLGEAAWEAHLRWGAAKASALAADRTTSAAPRAVVVSTNLLDVERIRAAATQAGFVVEPVPAGAAVAGLLERRPPQLLIVDLSAPDADTAIRTGRATGGMRIVAFGPHVDDIGLARARALGADAVVPRSRFFRDLGRWFGPIA